MKLYLNPEQNPEYGSIIERFYQHGKRWSELNKEIVAFRTPTIYSPKTKRRLLAICDEIAELQQRWSELNHEAVRFHANPHYRFPDEKVDTVTFQHYQDVLINRINHYESTMTLLTSNYNLTDANLKHVLNFNIAIASFALSFIGLVLSLAK